MILNYLPNTNHIGLYVALENGYYKEEGLNVKIIESAEGSTPVLVCHRERGFRFPPTKRKTSRPQTLKGGNCLLKRIFKYNWRNQE